MVDDLIHECEEFSTAHTMWAYLRGTYGGTSVTRLRQLNIKFDTYKKRHDLNIKQHLRSQGVQNHSRFKCKKNWKGNEKDTESGEGPSKENSGSIDHMSQDQEAFVELCRVSSKSRWIYVENNVKLEVKGKGSCKVDLCGGRSLMLHDVLYAPEIRQNLVFVSVLLDDEIDEGEPLYEILNSEDHIISSDILDNSMDQEMIFGPSGSYESQNPIEESELQIQLDEPNFVTDALSSPKRDEWLKVMKEELESMKTNKVWDLVYLPEECKAIGNNGF
ncbi:hypothetical protein KY290_011743 [Solanum tuberosum]|uniref:Retrovirus-related Pol polyprotein from transposon TNT 1-94-like beta-barrel domain-containing protein n=1 Tax=Solanum tuberosum TaxID=4113 RepID=A0ABQ7W1J7_SOLTU|nr:hypothetical protein KY289_012856 [Solanum tuberosum]KAH0710406.1 hypothetical protein KY284_011833 [Solanum tuberosum]KAH0736641.1 hypothetical protein KY285_012348 [Solanum tuberosum]KAH0774606.1 hypothetical protein KY290_011743 [Solanum tuberosum]